MTALNRLVHILESKLYGSIVIGYHRTRTKERIDDIKEEGMKVGPRSMYGPGLYFTYDFKSQQEPYMLKQYGEYIIKARLNIHNFFFASIEAGELIYGKGYHPVDILVRKLKLSFDEAKELHQEYKEITEKNPDFSSVFARKCVLKYKTRLYKAFDGIQFVGSKDGRVLVAWKTSPAVVKPFGWARVNRAKQHILDPKQIKWHPYNVTEKVPLDRKPLLKVFRNKVVAVIEELGYKTSDQGETYKKDNKYIIIKTTKGYFVNVKTFFSQTGTTSKGILFGNTSFGDRVSYKEDMALVLKSIEALEKFIDTYDTMIPKSIQSTLNKAALEYGFPLFKFVSAFPGLCTQTLFHIEPSSFVTGQSNINATPNYDGLLFSASIDYAGLNAVDPFIEFELKYQYMRDDNQLKSKIARRRLAFEEASNPILMRMFRDMLDELELSPAAQLNLNLEGRLN